MRKKIHSRSRFGRAASAERASVRRPGRLPSEAGKFEPQAIREDYEDMAKLVKAVGRIE